MDDNSSSLFARRLLPSALLLLLVEAPSHGYALEERLAGIGRFGLPAGSVYRELRRMEAAGTVTSAWEMAEEGGSPRRTYEITDLGRQWLDRAVIDMHGSVETIDRLLARLEDGPAVVT
jgi:PadR family transcriptional regulator PadR